jgi:DNA-binding PadR family transcriptional regulator
MSLRHVLLVYLGSGGASGSDIIKGFQHTFGYLWNASFQQIYRDLGKLHDDGLLDCETVDNTPRPPRKVYRLNQAGWQAMQTWLAKPAPIPHLNDAFMVKLASVHLQDPEVLMAELRQLQEHYRDALSYLQQKRAVFESLPASVLEKFLGVFLTLKRGISLVESWLSWSEEVAAMLTARRWQQLTPEDVQLFINTVQGDDLPHPGKSAKNGWKKNRKQPQHE